MVHEPSTMNHVVTIYSRPDCHLCERARKVLHRVQLRARSSLVEVDTSQNSEPLPRYGRDIPVILLDGSDIGRHFVRERKLLRLSQ
jgi:glutaredoxin